MDVSLVITLINEIISFTDRRKLKGHKVVEAIVCLQKAINATKIHFNKNGEVKSTELSNIWLDVFEKVKKAGITGDPEFENSLYYKAQYWAEPKQWNNQDASMELVPALSKVQDECDALLERLK